MNRTERGGQAPRGVQKIFHQVPRRNKGKLKVGKHNKIQIEAGKRTNVQGGCQLNQVDQRIGTAHAGSLVGVEVSCLCGRSVG